MCRLLALYLCMVPLSPALLLALLSTNSLHRGFVDASGSSETRERWACLLLIEYAWSGLPGAVSDEGRMKMLMFVELSEASLFLPCVAGGMICSRKRVILRLIAPKRLKVAVFSLNFSADVTSCSCAMILMNTCFLSAR